jgi:hypothetical protein
VLRAKHDILKGVELTIFYGNYGNDDIIFRYGFASDTTQVIVEHLRAKIESDESMSRAGANVDGEVQRLQICAVRKRMAVEFLAKKMAVLREHLLLPLGILDTIEKVLVETDNAARVYFSPSLPNRILQQRMELQNQPGDMDPQPNNTNDFDEASNSMDTKKCRRFEFNGHKIVQQRVPASKSIFTTLQKLRHAIQKVASKTANLFRGMTVYGGATGCTDRKPRIQTCTGSRSRIIEGKSRQSFKSKHRGKIESCV